MVSEEIVMDDRSQQILEFAVAKEKEAEKFYLCWSERANNEEVSRLLAELASDERGHVEKLSNITPDALIAEGPGPPDFKLSELLADVPAKPDMTIVEALAVAIRREVKAIALYDWLRRSATTEEALFAALVEEERRHKHRLELNYAKLKRHLSGS